MYSLIFTTGDNSVFAEDYFQPEIDTHLVPEWSMGNWFKIKYNAYSMFFIKEPAEYPFKLHTRWTILHLMIYIQFQHSVPEQEVVCPLFSEAKGRVWKSVQLTV